MNAPAGTRERPRRAPKRRRWAPVRVYDAVGDRVSRLRPGLEVDDVVREAQEAAGTTDLWFDDGWREGLTVLLDALSREGDLTPSGRVFARGAVGSALANRAALARAWAADPGIATRPVGPAAVVVGLPRSGTTLLQHLLALDPDVRSLRQWEASRPAPPPASGDPEADDPRVVEAQRGQRMLDRLAPDARRLHPTGPHLPTECVTLFVNSFASLELGVVYQVPSYVRWCLDNDMREHYAAYVRQLQVLGRHGERATWALKAPAHLFWLGELTEALPESTVVQLHRDPAEVTASFLELTEVLRTTNVRRVDRARIAAEWAPLWVEGVRRAEAARPRVDPGRWLDLRYRDLVADPVGAVAAVYDATGRRFTDRMAAAVRDHVDRNPAGRPTAPRATLADFGLDTRTVRDAFAEVCSVQRY